MPPDAVEGVRRVAAALGVALTRAQVAHLVRFLALLQRWNTTYNLTAVRDPAEMLTQHLADCLAIVPPLQRWADGRNGTLRVLDVGSGGGLPGAILAIVMPRFDVTCVDAVGKKVAFVQQVAVELQLANLHAEHRRVETISAAGYDVVVSRAFAALGDFVRLTTGALAVGGVWLAMKGKRPDAEEMALPAGIEVFHVEPLAVPGMSAERCLVWMRRRTTESIAGGTPPA